MKNFLNIGCGLLFLLAASAWAGSEMDGKASTTIAQATATPVPLDIFKFEQGYVFESDLNHGGSHGKQDEIQSEIEYGHRIHLNGNWYVHVGLSYDRYDFGSTASPVPNHLQAMAAVVGADYMHGSDVGAFFQVRPGFYTQNDLGISSFDAPITLGRIFVLQPDKLYVFGGAYASFLRGGFPVLPLLGVIWIPSEQWRIMGALPEPRLIYSATKKLDLWAGGELVGGSFRTDNNEGLKPGKLRGAQVDFSEYRAGVGLAYDVTDNFTVDFGAGYSIQRDFNFSRAGETYRTDPAPYVRLEMKAEF
jgi:opacity protein-like surface antigen